MAYSGDDQVLIRIAVFGIAMSVMCTAMITVLLSDNGSGDYDFDEIQEYRKDLSSFTGQSMLNQTPWVLQHVYTPWTPDLGTTGHVTDDNWLFGEEVDDYPYLGQNVRIKLDPTQKSSIILGIDDRTYQYQYETDNPNPLFDKNSTPWQIAEWLYSKDTAFAFIHSRIDYVNQGMLNLADLLGIDTNLYATGEAHMWNYTGYRYVFDPTLPFQTDSTSIRDGALSIVWYSYLGQEGLSGALDVYGGDVLLGSYSAMDIITAYNTSSGYATHFDFDFEGTTLSLYVSFDPVAIESGTPLMEAWTTGQWSMAISSVSVGNFLDVNNSTSYSATGGSMIKTFIQIYTLSLPSIHNEWMDIVLWLLVGLPMTLALALVTLKIMNAVKIL